MRRNIIILFKLWVWWIQFSSIDSFCNSKNVSCEMLLITEVLEWFNSASMPYFLFEHRSLIKYYVNQRIFLPKYATLNPNFTAHSMPSFKFDNVFYVANFPFLGRWLQRVAQQSWFYPHLQISLIRVKNWALFGRNQVGICLQMSILMTIGGKDY